MTTDNTKKMATAIVNHIKAEIKRRNQIFKDNPYACVDADIHFEIDSIYNPEVKGYVDYININGKEFRGTQTMRDIEEVSREVIGQLTALKATRGWKNLMFNTRAETEGVGFYNVRKYTLLDRVSLPSNPCKEYVSLKNYLNKYANANISDFEFFSSYMGGKRGVLWDESGDRRYLDNKPKKCAMELAELRKHRGSKDIIVCKRGEEDYIDDAERRYSQYHEVECSGEKRKYLEVVVKNANGKVKYTTKIY